MRESDERSRTFKRKNKERREEERKETKVGVLGG